MEAGGLFRLDFKGFGSRKYVTSHTGVTMNARKPIVGVVEDGITQIFWSPLERVSRTNWQRFEMRNMNVGVCFLCFHSSAVVAVPGRVVFPPSWRESSMCSLFFSSDKFSCFSSYLIPRLPAVHCGDPVVSSEFLAIV